MADDLSAFLATREPTPDRPLLGLTVLVVEDSRFACEAMRLLCLRSGARIRRADCLRSARRHLMTYRPTVVIVDLGLPDGSGLDLISEVAARRPRVPALLGTSGDAGAEERARAAGADGFLAKPIESLSAFQRTILAALPATPKPVAADRAARRTTGCILTRSRSATTSPMSPISSATRRRVRRSTILRSSSQAWRFRPMMRPCARRPRRSRADGRATCSG